MTNNRKHLTTQIMYTAIHRPSENIDYLLSLIQGSSFTDTGLGLTLTSDNTDHVHGHPPTFWKHRLSSFTDTGFFLHWYRVNPNIWQHRSCTRPSTDLLKTSVTFQESITLTHSLTHPRSLFIRVFMYKLLTVCHVATTASSFKAKIYYTSFPVVPVSP